MRRHRGVTFFPLVFLQLKVEGAIPDGVAVVLGVRSISPLRCSQVTSGVLSIQKGLLFVPSAGERFVGFGGSPLGFHISGGMMRRCLHIHNA